MRHHQKYEVKLWKDALTGERVKWTLCNGVAGMFETVVDRGNSYGDCYGDSCGDP